MHSLLFKRNLLSMQEKQLSYELHVEQFSLQFVQLELVKS